MALKVPTTNPESIREKLYLVDISDFNGQALLKCLSINIKRNYSTRLRISPKKVCVGVCHTPTHTFFREPFSLSLGSYYKTLDSRQFVELFWAATTTATR